MNRTALASAKWGVAIGLANLIWLYLAYYLGLHTSGIMVFQVFMLIWFAVTLTGFVLALRSIKRGEPSVGYLRGLAAGTIAAVASAIIAVIAQVGYYTVIHPQWPDFMARQTREHFTALGLASVEVERMVEQARDSFTLSRYAVSSAATALIVGITLSAIIMAFLCRRPSSVAS